MRMLNLSHRIRGVPTPSNSRTGAGPDVMRGLALYHCRPTQDFPGSGIHGKVVQAAILPSTQSLVSM